jgi:hypothetical protein
VTFQPWLPLVNTLLLTISGILLAGIVTSLLEDAKISFDVSNFFSLSIFSLISFIILCLLVLIFYHLSEILLLPLLRNKVKLIGQLPGILLAGAIVLFQLKDNNLFFLYAGITAWVMGYILLVNLRRTEFLNGLSASPFYIIWVMFFALSVASLVMVRFRQVEWLQREKMAERLVHQSDPFGENLLSIAATNFDDKWLQNNFNRFSLSEQENKMLKDSLTRQNFSGYLN